MQRLIDADALIEEMTKFSNATGEDMTHGIFYAHIAPAIDAEPVRHGKWIFESIQGHAVMTCSECCKVQDGQTLCFTYCPNCGCRMDEG